MRLSRFLLINTIFAVTAIAIERVGISLNMYVYSDTFSCFFDVPIVIIVSWVILGHASWVVYKRFGWIAGLLTGIVIDLPLEFLAFYLGWWSWIPSWTPSIFFNAPVLNFSVYLGVSFGSILIYKYVRK